MAVSAGLTRHDELRAPRDQVGHLVLEEVLPHGGPASEAPGLARRRSAEHDEIRSSRE